MSSLRVQAQEAEQDKPLSILSPSQQTLLTAPHFPSPIANIDQLRARASDKGAVNVVTQKLKRDRGTRRSTRGSHTHVSATARPSISAAGYGGPVADRITMRVLEKVKNTLPVYSGFTLDDLAHYAPMTSTIQYFCCVAASSPTQSPQRFFNSESSPSSSLSTTSTSVLTPNSPTPHTTGGVNVIARELCDLLQRVSQLHAPPVQILHSQVFLLQTLLRILSARAPESLVPGSEPVDVDNKLDAPDSSPSTPAPNNAAAHISTPHPTLHSLHDPTPGTRSIPTPNANSTANTTDTRVPTTSYSSSHHISPVNTTSPSFDPATTSYMLSTLLTFIPCRTTDLDLVDYPTTTTPQPPSPLPPHSHLKSTPFHRFSSHPHTHPSSSQIPSSPSKQKYPLSKPLQSLNPTTSPTFAHPQLLHTRLTPLPPIPLHGFEEFASPALHADGAGTLCPNAVLEHGTNTQLHPNNTVPTPPHSSSTQLPVAPPASRGRGTYISPYTSLHAHLDVYPPTLCFLPPAMLLARYAARCIYFLSKCGGEGEGHMYDNKFRPAQTSRTVDVGAGGKGRGGEGRDGKGSCDVVWERIISGVERLAGAIPRLAMEENRGGIGEFSTRTPKGGVIAERGTEKDSRKDKDKDKQKQKQWGIHKEGTCDFASKMHRRNTMIGPIWSATGLHESDEGKTLQSRSGEDGRQQSRLRSRSISRKSEEDVTELRMLGYVAMRKGRLGGVVTALASLIVNMSTPARGAAAAAIRAGIFAWLENAPGEFVKLAGGNPSVYNTGNCPHCAIDTSHAHGTNAGKASQQGSQQQSSEEHIDGAEKLLELMSSYAKEDFSNTDLENEYCNAGASGGSVAAGGKQTVVARALLWTGVGALFCVCTGRVRGAEAGHTDSFLTQMARFIRTPGPSADIALRVYADICRAAFFVPPYGWKVGDDIEAGEASGRDGREERDIKRPYDDMGECPLRAVAREVVNELAFFLEHSPPYNAQAIDTDLYTDALVTIYRFSPPRAVHLIRAWLAPTCGEAVKLCVVQAALRLVIEARAFPWQPGLGPFVECCSQPINILLRNILRGVDDGASAHPLSLSPSHPDRGTLRRTLLLSLQGLLRLDLAFVLCGPSVADLAGVICAGLCVLAPQRDHGAFMMYHAMHAAGIAGARRIHREGARLLRHSADVSEAETPLYKEAVEYLKVTVLETLFACAQQVVHVWSNTENLLCLRVIKYILGILTDSPEDGEDTSWRRGEARFPALAMAEVALIIAFKSSQRDISCTAVDSLPLLIQALRDPDAPPPTYMAHNQHPAWRAYHTAAAKATTATLGQGQVAAQKRVREEVTSNAFPCATHLAGWREAHFRWSVLSPLVRVPEGADGPQPSLEIGPVTYKDRQAEWANYGLALARASVVCQDDIDLSLFKVLGTHIPDRMPLHQQPKKLVYEFVRDMVEMLNADMPHVRETAKQALGAELHLTVVSTLFDRFNLIVPELLKDVDVILAPKDNLILFVRNCVGVLSLLVDRMDDTTLGARDVGSFILPLARFLNLPVTTASDLRTRTQLCGVIDFFLKRGDIFTFHQDLSYRQILLDNTMSWSNDMFTTTMSPEDQSMPEYVRSLRTCQIAALQTASKLAKNLELKPLEKPTSMDTQNDVSRLFHRYLTAFVKGLDLGKVAFSEDYTNSKSESMRTSQSIYRTALDETHIHETVIAGITNLIDSNTDVGFKQCVAFGYDNDARLRTIFMEVFSRVLKRGTRFDTRDNLKLGSKDGQICEIVRNSEVLVDCIVTVCSASETNLLTSVLLNIFDTRRAMLALAQRLIDREINEAESPMKLFRENNFINSLLSTIVNQYGYRYLRTVLEPLIEQTLHELEDKSFELDPTKLQPGEDLNANRRVVSHLAQTFIDAIIASAPRLPSIIIDICRFISTMVINSWPESRYTAVGGFLFLRFFCPAIVSPASIDIELPAQDSQTQAKLRRGLLILAKILQSLSNNLMFGREAHMTFLNPLLESNIGPMTKFIEESFISYSAEHTVDRWLGVTYDATDSMILHHFFQHHHDDIGRILVFGAGASANNPTALRESPAIWVQLCDILEGLGSIVDLPRPNFTSLADDVEFQQYLMQNAHRNRDPVRHIFFPCEDRPDVLVLQQQALNIETVDLHLLRYHLCYTLKEYLTAPHDCILVLDYTRFKSTAELPIDWLKNGIEAIPADMRSKIRAMYILNANALTLRFFRKFFLLSPESYLAKEVHAVSSVSELFEHIGHVGSIWKSSIGLLEAESAQVFKNVHQRYVYYKASAVTLEVRETHLRITSLNPQEITPRMFCKTVEIIPLDEVDDIYRIASDADSDLNEFVISRYRRDTAMQFSSRQRNAIIQVIRTAKFRTNSPGLHALHQFSGLSDITVTLFTIGMINSCHEQEWIRGSATVLLSAVCSYLKYEVVSAILPATSASYILSPSLALILFSERVASFAPHLTLDFIIELRWGFNRASIDQKIVCLRYLPPWIRNISRFATPGDALYDQSGGKLRDAIHSLCDISLRDKDIYHQAKQCVWVELSKMNDMTLGIIMDEIIRLAVDSGINSSRCGLVVDVIMILSSIQVRSHIIYRLRQALRKQTLSRVTSDADNTAWSEVATLSRLALAASNNPRVPAQNQLFISETVHMVTMLAAAGPLEMRTSIYGLVMNLLHTLSNKRTPDEAGTPEYLKMVVDVSGPSTRHLFGISLAHSGMGYALTRKPSEHYLATTAVEDISEILLKVIENGVGTRGFVNVLKARWMSLVTATAFQSFPYMQARAFTVLGVLMKNSLNNELLYQILVSLKSSIQHSPDGNCIATLSMLRCMRTLIPGLDDSPLYLCDVFWIGIALLQTGHLPYYAESMHLIRAALEKLEAQSAFVASNVPSVLLQARSILVDELAGFDELSGFSFTDELSFSLSTAFLLYAVSQHQKLRPIAGDVLRAFLRVASRSPQTDSSVRMNTRGMDSRLVGFFLGLLPFCTTVASLRQLLEDSGVDVPWWESNGLFSGTNHGGYRCAIPFSILGVSDVRSAQLIIGFLVSMIELHVGDIPEREILYSLLADANEHYPSIVSESQGHYLMFIRGSWIDERINHAYAGHSTTPILTAKSKILKSLLTFEDQWNLANRSTSTLSASSHEDSPTPHYLALEELGMSGLVTHLHSYHKNNDFALFSHLFEDLLERILES